MRVPSLGKRKLYNRLPLFSSIFCFNKSAEKISGVSTYAEVPEEPPSSTKGKKKNRGSLEVEYKSNDRRASKKSTESAKDERRKSSAESAKDKRRKSSSDQDPQEAASTEPKKETRKTSSANEEKPQASGNESEKKKRKNSSSEKQQEKTSETVQALGQQVDSTATLSATSASEKTTANAKNDGKHPWLRLNMTSSSFYKLKILIFINACMNVCIN